MTAVERIGVWLYVLTVAVLTTLGWGSLTVADWPKTFLLAWLVMGGSWMIYLREQS